MTNPNPIQGTLGGSELTATLRTLQASEASGVLRVARDGCEKRIELRRGRIVSVSSDAESDDDELGRVLLERGRLEPGELETARRIRMESGKSLPQVLADLALLESSEIEVARAELERSALSTVLSWRDGEYRFERGETPAAASDLDAPASPRMLRWAANAAPLAEGTLSTKESALLDFLRAPSNQNLSASEIIARSPLTDSETIQILSKLLASGVIEDRDAAAHPVDPSSTFAGARSTVVPAWSLQPPTAAPEKLGRFVVERALGRGSMGAVLLAKDPAIDRIVAIKLIQTAGHLSSAQSEKYRERFYREASAAGQLLHPNIATVFDVGHADDGTPFIVMEYVKGETLRDQLETRTFSVAETLGIARDVLEALRFAHSQGIVHRDVKPSNIMVTPDGHGKIMDFGIAHVVGSELTSAEDVLGSPYYMAPEQLSKGPIGPHTDLFAFAVVLYRMLTGLLPFIGESFAAIAHAILHESPASPELFSKQIPKPVADVVLRCLEKAPEDRYQSADEVLRALADAASGKPGPAPSRPVAKAKPWALGGSFLVAGKRLNVLASLIVVGLVALVLVATQLSMRSSPTPPVNPASTADPTSPPGPATATEAGVVSPSPAPLPAPAPAPPVTPATADPSISTPSAPSPKPSSPAAAKGTPKPGPAPQPSTPEPRHAVEPESGPEAVSPGPAGAPTVADLFYAARLALERGELEEAKVRLDALLARDPAFAGGAELYIEVTDEIWERRLPIMIAARHNHRLGGCEGELSLATIGVRFESSDHEYAFAREDIRVLEHPDAMTLVVETYEKDLLSLGKNKRYKFDLETPLSEDDWTRYQRLIK